MKEIQYTGSEPVERGKFDSMTERGNVRRESARMRYYCVIASVMLFMLVRLNRDRLGDRSRSSRTDHILVLGLRISTVISTDSHAVGVSCQGDEPAFVHLKHSDNQ